MLDFGNIEAYPSETQRSISEVNGFYNPKYTSTCEHKCLIISNLHSELLEFYRHLASSQNFYELMRNILAKRP
jgi:hypothetical protein